MWWVDVYQALGEAGTVEDVTNKQIQLRRKLSISLNIILIHLAVKLGGNYQENAVCCSWNVFIRKPFKG